MDSRSMRGLILAPWQGVSSQARRLCSAQGCFVKPVVVVLIVGLVGFSSPRATAADETSPVLVDSSTTELLHSQPSLAPSLVTTGSDDFNLKPFARVDRRPTFTVPPLGQPSPSAETRTIRSRLANLSEGRLKWNRSGQRYSGTASGTGGGQGRSDDWIWTVVAFGSGAASLAYGRSETCKTSGPGGTSECGLALTLGVALVGVGILFLLTMGSKGRGASSGSQPAQPSLHPSDAPGGVAEDAARQEITHIREGVHGDLPMARVVGRCSGVVTTTTVENRTGYPLYLYLSGPESRTLAIDPGRTVDLRLEPGRYDVAARVSAPNVRPFAGGWELSRGCPYGSTFYIGPIQ
jgi:hypothetical protein